MYLLVVGGIYAFSLTAPVNVSLARQHRWPSLKESTDLHHVISIYQSAKWLNLPLRILTL